MTSDVPIPPPVSSPVAGQQAPAQRARRRRISPKLILVVLIFAATLWFVLVNTRHMNIKLWIPTVSAPVWLVLLCTFGAGLIAGLLLGWRRRRVR
jgi:uncharacterized integral membrane protein